jgi:hypothetical protein
MFIPDEGMTIVEMDLKGADAMVVAWEADDPSLKKKVSDPRGLHFLNTKDIWSDDKRVQSCRTDDEMQSDPYLARLRHMAKSGVHATNYVCQPRTLAQTLQTSVREAEHFQTRYFTAHPGVRQWHTRVETALATTRKVHNAFGYHCFFFDRPELTLPRALAWIAQSTVAITVNKALVRVDTTYSPHGLEILLQVHDSFVFQIPTEAVDRLLPFIAETARIVIPYPDPLIIPFSIKLSETSWGETRTYVPNPVGSAGTALPRLAGRL